MVGWYFLLFTILNRGPSLPADKLIFSLHVTRSIFYKKQSEIQTSHVSYFFEIFDGFCFLVIEGDAKKRAQLFLK